MKFHLESCITESSLFLTHGLPGSVRSVLEEVWIDEGVALWHCRWWKPSRCCEFTCWNWKRWTNFARTSAIATHPAWRASCTARTCCGRTPPPMPTQIPRIRSWHLMAPPTAWLQLRWAMARWCLGVGSSKWCRLRRAWWPSLWRWDTWRLPLLLVKPLYVFTVLHSRCLAKCLLRPHLSMAAHRCLKLASQPAPLPTITLFTVSSSLVLSN